jgi:fructose-1,6-bisphosphatase/inositol monophosphatase family enzyme
MPATGDLFHARADRKAFLGDKEIRVSRKKNVKMRAFFLRIHDFINVIVQHFQEKSVIWGVPVLTFVMLQWAVPKRL